jgi:hypothetical protein
VAGNYCSEVEPGKSIIAEDFQMAFSLKVKVPQALRPYYPYSLKPTEVAMLLTIVVVAQILSPPGKDISSTFGGYSNVLRDVAFVVLVIRTIQDRRPL